MWPFKTKPARDMPDDDQKRWREYADDLLFLVMCYLEQIGGPTDDREILKARTERNVDEILRPRAGELIDRLKTSGARTLVEDLITEFRNSGLM